jgi:hypothetical protein
VSARPRGIARQTEQIVAAGSHRTSDGREVSVAAAVEAARDGTRMQGPVPVAPTPPAPAPSAPGRTVFEITGDQRGAVRPGQLQP